MWTEAFLIFVILILLGWMLFSGEGRFKTRKLRAQVDSLRDELERLRSTNEALRSKLEADEQERARYLEEIQALARDLDILKSAVAGSTHCQRILVEKYGTKSGLLDLILASHPKIEPRVKRKLAHEILVGEVGRIILRDLDSKLSIERAAGDAGIPVIMAREHVKRLQVLGYLDERLKPTELGREALA
jgi:outer membrane murein-binding lipoprotein Lpp